MSNEWNLPDDTEKVSIERSGGYVWDTAVYPATVKMAYLDQAQSKAISLNLILNNEAGQELKETMYIKSGNAKGNKTYYEKDGKKYPLPSYSLALSLSIAATGNDIPTIMKSLEMKSIKIYDFEQKKEVAKERHVVMALIGAKVQVAVNRIKENKSKKNAAGDYEDTKEIHEINECKFFGNEAGFSSEEILAGVTAPKKLAEWHKQNAGNIIDKTSKTIGTGAKSAANIMGSDPAAKPVKSLFS